MHTINCSNIDFNSIIVNCGCCHYNPCLLTSLLLSVSQRIAAADLAPGLLYFGRSIHGTMDMNNDGLVDLAVGSLGAAVLLWLVFHPVNNTVVLFNTAIAVIFSYKTNVISYFISCCDLLTVTFTVKNLL